MWIDLLFAQVSRSVERNMHTTFSFQNPLSESKELLTWGSSKILLTFLMRFDGHFWKKSPTATMFTSVLVNFRWATLSSSTSSHLKIGKTTQQRFIGSQPHSHKPFAPIPVFLSQIDQLRNKILWQISVHFRHPCCIRKPDFTRQVITCTMSKTNKWNSVCERMLVDST